MDDPEPELLTRRLHLRLPRQEDAHEITRLAGDPEISANTLEIPYPYNERMARDWISEVDQKRDQRSELVFIIANRTSGEIIGAVGLMSLDQEHSRGKIGYWIGRPFWNRGYATEAVCAVLDYSFRVLNLRRVYAFYLTRNKASGRVMDKCGMRYEGVLRQHIKKNGNFEDVAIHGILREEYLSNG
ncbi:MAG: GNAT family N-acetyltransferase [Methanoregulaceae archaeon]|nr:GNAT family N-acetyltransferase [Methanoregulaceae archaeon]